MAMVSCSGLAFVPAPLAGALLQAASVAATAAHTAPIKVSRAGRDVSGGEYMPILWSVIAPWSADRAEKGRAKPHGRPGQAIAPPRRCRADLIRN
jgi:hypothetical protein